MNKIIACLLIIACCFLAACTKKDDAIAIQGEKEIVVKVNGTALTRQQMHRELINLLLTVGAGMPPEVLQQKANEFELQAIQNLINTELLVEEAGRRGLAVTQEEIRAQIETLRTAYESVESFALDLEIREMSEAELAEEAKRGLLVGRLLDQELQKIQAPSDGEIVTFYETNRESLIRPEQVKASHIQIALLPDDPQTVREAKREEIERIRGEIVKGADFGDMAGQYSSCPSSAQKGDLGWVFREQIAPELADALFTTPVGEMTQILESQAGYHLLLVREHRSAMAPEFQEISDDIRRFLLDQRRQTAIQSFIESLRNRASIEIVKVS